MHRMYKPNRKWSRLLLGTNSKMSNFSFPSKQNPNSLTRFLCWSLATAKISFLNSSTPCPELFESLFTAISCLLSNIPWECTAITIRMVYFVEFIKSQGQKLLNFRVNTVLNDVLVWLRKWNISILINIGVLFWDYL